MQIKVPKIYPLFPGLFSHEEGIGRGAGQHRGAEVLHDHNLAFGIPAGHGDHRCSQTLGAVMCSKSAGKKTVTVGVVDDITLVDPGGDKGAGHQLGPDVDVFPGIADHGWFAGSAGGCMNPDDILHRRGKQAVGVAVSHILFEGKGQTLQIFQRLLRSRADTRLLEVIPDNMEHWHAPGSRVFCSRFSCSASRAGRGSVSNSSLNT